MNNLLSFEEFCSKYVPCSKCPLYTENDCKGKYDELLANNGRIVLDLTEEMRSIEKEIENA